MFVSNSQMEELKLQVLNRIRLRGNIIAKAHKQYVSDYNSTPPHLRPRRMAEFKPSAEGKIRYPKHHASVFDWEGAISHIKKSNGGANFKPLERAELVRQLSAYFQQIQNVNPPENSSIYKKVKKDARLAHLVRQG